jgi:very-short-patch-repair endonuclease
VNPLLRSLLDLGDGLVTRDGAQRVALAGQLEWARHAGQLRRLLPGVYTAAGGPHPGFELLRRAALLWADGRGALSHLTGLDVWGLRRQIPGEPVHLSVPLGTGLRSRDGFVVHQRGGFVALAPQVLIRGGLPVTRIERCLAESWPYLSPADRPAPVIRAVNDRMTTPDRISAALDGVPKLTDRAQLRALLDRLVAGCRSPLEIWGHDRVFTGPGMPTFDRQTRVRVGARTCYLDVFARRERVDFELDGATTHGDARQREIDLRRDALLATAGILVVRYPHRRLVYETAEVRREILAILAARRSTST